MGRANPLLADGLALYSNGLEAAEKAAALTPKGVHGAPHSLLGHDIQAIMS